MNEDECRRVEAARERALATAREFFEGLPPEQLDAAQAQLEGGDACAGPPIDREEMGTVYEDNDWMPKADYLEMHRIISAFQSGAPTADESFETILRILRESKEAIVRATRVCVPRRAVEA